MTDEQKVYFLQGYIYRLAEEAKDLGLFPDLTIEEICNLYVEESIRIRGRHYPLF